MLLDSTTCTTRHRRTTAARHGTAARLGSRNTRYIYNMYADKQQNSSACQKLDAAFSHNGLTRVAVHGDVHGGHCMAVHLLA